MKKKLVIDCCNECPHFDNYYHEYRELCIKLDRKIEEDKDSIFIYSIPDDCPLEDAGNE